MTQLQLFRSLVIGLALSISGLALASGQGGSTGGGGDEISALVNGQIVPLIQAYYRNETSAETLSESLIKLTNVATQSCIYSIRNLESLNTPVRQEITLCLQGVLRGSER